MKNKIFFAFIVITTVICGIAKISTGFPEEFSRFVRHYLADLTTVPTTIFFVYPLIHLETLEKLRLPDINSREVIKIGVISIVSFLLWTIIELFEKACDPFDILSYCVSCISTIVITYIIYKLPSSKGG